MKLTINRDLYSVDNKDANRKLLWFLRDDLRLIGTRFGCGAGICGACTVLVDGQPRRSCITSLSSVADGPSIRTVEDLAATGSLHPVQQAFIDEQTPQCGWCMSGQMMVAVALLDTCWCHHSNASSCRPCQTGTHYIGRRAYRGMRWN